MKSITSKKSGLNPAVSFVLLNGRIIGNVEKKGTSNWYAYATGASYKHITVTGRTKKETMEELVHKFLTDGREGY